MKAPFPWFGGKSKVAELVWDRFGNVPNVVEPFFGSGALLLGRPKSHAPFSTETINDLDCMVANFWRALKNDPDAVAFHADNPVNEADQHARHLWLCSQAEFREQMKVDPEFYDTKIAGWWVWGQCIWIGSGWCSVQLPHLGDAGKGLSRQLPHLGNAGTGVEECLSDRTSGTRLNRQVPVMNSSGMGVCRVEPREADMSAGILAYMRQLADRLRRVRVCCGDWGRICGPSVTWKHGITGVFLDPPYGDAAKRDMTLYSEESGTVAADVRRWAIENGDNPELRIALCGYEGEHEMPDSWECVAWKASGGYGSQGTGSARGNRHRERIWFSPACLLPNTLFEF